MLLLAAEFGFHHVVGLAGVLNPEQGTLVQRTLILWGLLAAVIVGRLLFAGKHRAGLPLLAAILFLGASIAFRVPAAMPSGQAAVAIIVTWVRLALPIMATAAVLVSIPKMAAGAEAKMRFGPTATVLTMIAAVTASVLAVRLAAGHPWSWSPQEPIPYLLLASMGAAGLLSSFRFGIFLVLSLLSLKRSAVLAMALFVLLIPKRKLKVARKTLTRGALVAGILISVVAITWGPDATDILENRAMTGLEDVRDVLQGRGTANTSIGLRVVENAIAWEAWTATPQSLLFGAPLERYQLGPKDALTVHNTPLSLLHLGGLMYGIVFLASVVPLRRYVMGHLNRRQYGWYLAAALAGLAESLAGNGSLTVTFGASVAVLLLPRRHLIDRSQGTGRQRPIEKGPRSTVSGSPSS